MGGGGWRPWGRGVGIVFEADVLKAWQC
jgi:hypothetical protein